MNLYFTQLYLNISILQEVIVDIQVYLVFDSSDH